LTPLCSVKQRRHPIAIQLSKSTFPGTQGTLKRAIDISWWR